VVVSPGCVVVVVVGPSVVVVVVAGSVVVVVVGAAVVVVVVGASVVVDVVVLEVDVVEVDVLVVEVDVLVVEVVDVEVDVVVVVGQGASSWNIPVVDGGHVLTPLLFAVIPLKSTISPAHTAVLVVPSYTYICWNEPSQSK
jgi:hypothetical protein